MNTLDKALDSRLRRKAARLGHRLERSRERTWHWNSKGGYQLIDNWNTVVAGVDYDLTPEMAAYWLAEIEKKQAA